MSGNHAEILRRPDGLWIRDLGSTNGTFINGEQITEAQRLHEGDRIECGTGGTLFMVSLGDQDSAPTIVQSKVANSSTGSHRTAFYRAMMEETVQRSSSKLRWIIGAMTLLLIVGGVLLALYLRQQAQETDALKENSQVVRKQQEITAIELARADAGKTISQRYEKSLFLLMAEDKAGRLTGYCTAFVVNTNGILATNAHCIKTLITFNDKGARPLVRMNRNPTQTYQVENWKEHDEYNGTPYSADVGVLKLKMKEGERLPIAVIRAPPMVLHSLTAGQKIFTMGFVGKVMNEKRPAADIRSAIVSRLTTFGRAPGDAASNQLVWHTALTSKGTSGAPIFNADGMVVAINNGGLSAREIIVGRDEVTGELKKDTAYDATGLNFGIRVDTLSNVFKTSPDGGRLR